MAGIPSQRVARILAGEVNCALWGVSTTVTCTVVEEFGFTGVEAGVNWQLTPIFPDPQRADVGPVTLDTKT